MTDLDKLIDAVEGGANLPMDGSAYRLFVDGWLHVFDAFNGSLDAAKALHEALLPGWGWEVGVNSAIRNIAQVWESGRDKAFPAANDTPARAWLIAILKAYRSLQ